MPVILVISVVSDCHSACFLSCINKNPISACLVILGNACLFRYIHVCICLDKYSPDCQLIIIIIIINNPVYVHPRYCLFLNQFDLSIDCNFFHFARLVKTFFIAPRPSETFTQRDCLMRLDFPITVVVSMDRS